MRTWLVYGLSCFLPLLLSIIIGVAIILLVRRKKEEKEGEGSKDTTPTGPVMKTQEEKALPPGASNQLAGGMEPKRELPPVGGSGIQKEGPPSDSDISERSEVPSPRPPSSSQMEAEPPEPSIAPLPPQGQVPPQMEVKPLEPLFAQSPPQGQAPPQNGGQPSDVPSTPDPEVGKI